MADERYVDAPPAGAAGWGDVWRENRRYRTGGALQSLLARWFRRGGSAELDRQRDFNLALLDLLNDIRAEITSAREAARAEVAKLQADVQKGDEALAKDIAGVRDLIPIASRRNDALVAALDQKIESVAARLRDVVNPVLQTEDRGPRTEDFLYRRLEESLRGSEKQVRDAIQPYVEYSRTHQPVLDIGCGRGEFLMMCRESGVDVRGFDTNERSISDLKQRGFAADLAGVPDCFDAVADRSIGSILASHVVEHLPVDVLFAFYGQSARVLRAGGLLMIETPNAESLLVTGADFWRDPTHLAPRHPAALVLLGREHGFDVEELRAMHPFPDAARLPLSESDSPDVRRLAAAINERLFGPQDLRLVLRRR
ncbi:MAG TPA: class I SAM-dependent methyltransferase [Thermoanaerobaculia bacterium]|nr:class I SAM-dependent methyltransferase [Thermoanaerobaculia bacterium]